MNFNLKIKTHQNIVYRLQNISLVYVVFLWGNLNVFSQTNVTYTMQTGNFNALPTEKNNNPPYAGTYNNGATEIGQYANGGSFGNTPGAAAFQTFSSTGVGSGTARTLKVGDRFTVTCYVASNPSAGGYIGISFRASTTYTNFFSATDASTVARFQLDNTGNWKVYSGSSVVATSSSGPNADRTFSIEITSSNTFNATIGSETFYDLSFGTAGPISSFSIYTYGDSNANSFWKNGSLSNFGHSTGDGLRFGYGLSGSSSSSISGIVSDGINTNSTVTSLANVVRVGGASGSSVTLSGANTFTGLTTVNPNATLRLGASSTATNTGPLGTTGAGTTVTSGGVLDMNGFSLTSTATEALTINGTGISSGGALINSSGTGSTWAGTVALGSNSSVGGAGDLTLSGAISGTSTSFTKIGAGILTLSGTNSMTGSWLVNEGTLSVSSFGNNTNSQPITLGASSTSGKLLYRSTGAGGATTTVLTVAAGGGSIEHNSTSGLTFSQNATLNGTLTTNCSALAGNLTFSGVLSGNGGLTVNSTNTGETILSGANTYIGATTISAGTLRINAANRISNSSNLVLGGGTFSTGVTTGNSETLGTIQLTENSTILLGTGSHNLNFSASNSTAWTAGKTLTITGWTGTATGGTAGRIYVGSSGSGLTQAQLDAINFTGQQPGAQIISGTGEIVPNFTVTITSAQSGNWNSTSTWVGGLVPGSIDNVVIAAGHTVTVTADATCRKVNFTGTGGILTVNSNVTLTVTTAVAVDADANNNSSGIVSGSGTISCGSVTIGSSITPNASRTTSLTSTISSFTSSGSLSLFGRISASFTNNSSLNLQSGTFSVASISQATNASGCSTSILMNSGAQTGTLIYTGTTAWSQTGSGSSVTTLNGTGAAVNYAASSNQTVLNTTYTNLTLSGSGNKTLAAFGISGTLSIQGSAVGINIAPTFGASSTLEYKNVGTRTTNAIEWPASSGPSNLIIDNSVSIVTMLASAPRTLTGNLTLTAGTLADAGNTLIVQGNITGAGTHTGVGSIAMTGASKTISGATLTNLTLNNASGFSLSGSTTINGVLTFTNGRLSIGSNTLNLAGTVASMTTLNNITGSSTSNLSITGTGTIGTLLFNLTTASTTNVLNNLTINRSSTGVVNLGSALNIVGNISVTNGSLRSIGGNTLTMAGTTQSFTISNATGGSVLGTDNSAGNDLTLAIANGSTTTITGDATTTSDDDKKFFNVTVNAGGTLVLSRGILCKYGTFAVNGTLQINANGYIQTTPTSGISVAPTYGLSSLLRYNTNNTYGRGLEWSNTTGAGYPNDVQVSNNTTLNIRNGSDIARQIAGNLTVDSGSTLSLEGMTIASPTDIGLTVIGNIINNGIITLATTTERLKCGNFTNNIGALTTLSSNVGGDLELTGSLIDNGTFNSNNRAIFFTGIGVQDVSGTGNFNIDYIVSNKASGSIRMLTNLLVEGPNGGNAMTLINSTDILNLNGFALTLGKENINSSISGNGFLRGSSSSSISILGSGALGTLRFDQTTPGSTNAINSLTINRTNTGSVVLGNTVAVGNDLTITNGKLNLGINIHSAGSLILGGNSQTTSSSYGGTNSPAVTINDTYFATNVGVVNVGSCTDYSITSTTVTSSCAAGASIILANTITSNLPTGTYTVYYTLNGTNTGSYNATMSVNTAGSGTFSTGNLNIGSTTITIDYLRYGCVSKPVSGNSATFTVNANNSSGTASSTPTLCINTALTAITHTTTGATGISNSGVSGANGLPTGVSASWTSNSITITGAPSVSGTFNYSIPLTGGCGTVSANGTITVIALPASAGSNGSLSVCSTTTLTTAMLFAALTGSPAAGGTWSPAIPGSGSVAGVYTYTQMAISPCTPDNTATVTVAVQEPPASAGNNGTLLLCAGTTLTTNVLYDALTGTPVQGGVWSPSIPVSGSVAGTYTYAQVATSPCTVNNTAEVTVNESLTAIWNGNTWSPNTPDSTNSILFSGAFTSTEDIQACSLTVTNNATVIIDGHKVTLSGALVTDLGSSITFNNNSMLLQTGSGYNNSGVINFKKSSSPIFRLDYTLWTSPVLGQNLFNFSPLTLTNRFYTYNETTNFYTSNDVYTPGNPGLNSGSNFLIGRGYLVRSPNNWVSNTGTAASWTGTFTGVPNTGDIAISISKSTGANYGYNAVGNPYPSPISIADFLHDNSNIINSTLWFWRKTNGVSGSAYVTFSNGTYSSGPENNYNIQPGQGFFVKALNSGLLQFKNTQRIGTNGRFFRYNVHTNNVDAGRYWLNLFNNDILVGNLAIAYKDGATNDFDVDFDGEYINDSQMALTSYTSGKELAVQHRATPFSNTDVVPLSFKTDLAGTFTIGFNGSDGVLSSQDIYLEDLLLGQSIAIKTTPYTFVSEAGNFTNRFRITYINNSLGTNNTIFNSNQVVVYNDELNNNLVVNSGNVIMSKIKVFDVRGRLVEELMNVNATEANISCGSANEMLLIQVISQDDVSVIKKVVR